MSYIKLFIMAGSVRHFVCASHQGQSRSLISSISIRALNFRGRVNHKCNAKRKYSKNKRANVRCCFGAKFGDQVGKGPLDYAQLPRNFMHFDCRRRARAALDGDCIKLPSRLRKVSRGCARFKAWLPQNSKRKKRCTPPQNCIRILVRNRTSSPLPLATSIF